MRMCFMQEARRESVSVNYVLKNARFEHWLIHASRALARYLLLGGASSQTPPQIPMVLEHRLEKRPSQPMKQVT